jgi:hypothetical protein
VNIMRRLSLILCILLLVVTTCGASPADTTSDIASTRSGTPSQSFRSIVGLVGWLDDISLRDRIIASMKALDASIVSLLAKSGQRGAGVEVDVSHSSMTTADGRLVSKDRLVGDVSLI